jgi:GNAT superfamily N-acetyltransferase
MPFGLPNISFIGFPTPAPGPAHAGLGFRETTSRDLPGVLDHFARLSPDCRRRRFCATLAPAAVEAHARAVWDRSDVVLAAFDGPLWAGLLHRAGPIRAMAELAVDGRDAEIGLSVDEGLRRRGVGTWLVQTAARVLAPRGVARILAYTTPDNVAMMRLALRSGALIDRSSSDVEIAFDVQGLHRAYLRRRLSDRVFRRAG